ncbi:hypothetical protein NONO_c48620 [Nocardia nova SH22a]|uniref:Transmembrane protein n=1 Tax=Nocardia nova SH22a TaxID=1415166 RepID=W5TQX2_9NOCA|nr:hypothetical protein [Nocardia nova]AHH19646.1 hypothetical protein NONO_c48620 [Nocardia nova SH22a]
MASPNPRTSSPTENPATTPVIGSPRTSASGELRRILRLLCCAAFSAGTVVLLFRPWLTVSGPGGTIRSDAFGALGTEGAVQDSWAGSDLRMVEIGGGWAILACVAAVVVVVAAVGYLCTRTAMFAHAATVAGVVVVVSVLGDVLYLWGKAYELRNLVEDDGLSGVVGSLLGNTDTADAAASTHFGIAALLAGVAALGAAVSALLNYQPAVPARTSAAPVPASATRRAGTTPARSSIDVSRRSVSDSARARRERALTRSALTVTQPETTAARPASAQPTAVRPAPELVPTGARPVLADTQPESHAAAQLDPTTTRPAPANAQLEPTGARPILTNARPESAGAQPVAAHLAPDTARGTGSQVEPTTTRPVPADAQQQPTGAQLAHAWLEPDTARGTGTEVEPITAQSVPAVAQLGSSGAQPSAVTPESDAVPTETDDESGPAYRVVEPDPAVAAREPSWRIVIPAAEAYGRTSGVRTVTRARR